MLCSGNWNFQYRSFTRAMDYGKPKLYDFDSDPTSLNFEKQRKRKGSRMDLKKNLEAHYRKRVEDQDVSRRDRSSRSDEHRTVRQRRKKVCRDPDMVYRCNQWNHRDKSWYGSKLYKVDQDPSRNPQPGG